MAAVFCASLRRRAMVWRRRVIFTRSSRAASSAADGAAAPCGASRQRRGVSAGGDGAPLATAASTSPLSTWPRLPEPVTWRPRDWLPPAAWRRRSRRHSCASSIAPAAPATAAVFLAAAVTVSAPAAPAAWAAASGLASVLARELRPAAGAAAPIRSRRAARRRSTVSPGLAVISASTPADGAGTSIVTLSVSSSTSGLIGGDGVADLLEPLADGRLGDAFAQRGDADFDCHVRSSVDLSESMSQGFVEESWSWARWVRIRPVAVEAEAGRPM